MLHRFVKLQVSADDRTAKMELLPAKQISYPEKKRKNVTNGKTKQQEQITSFGKRTPHLCTRSELVRLKQRNMEMIFSLYNNGDDIDRWKKRRFRNKQLFYPSITFPYQLNTGTFELATFTIEELLCLQTSSLTIILYKQLFLNRRSDIPRFGSAYFENPEIYRSYFLILKIKSLCYHVHRQLLRSDEDGPSLSSSTITCERKEMKDTRSAAASKLIFTFEHVIYIHGVYAAEKRCDEMRVDFFGIERILNANSLYVAFLCFWNPQEYLNLKRKRLLTLRLDSELITLQRMQLRPLLKLCQNKICRRHKKIQLV